MPEPPKQESDRNLHEEWLNDTPEEEAAFWDKVKEALRGASGGSEPEQHTEPLTYQGVRRDPVLHLRPPERPDHWPKYYYEPLQFTPFDPEEHPRDAKGEFTKGGDAVESESPPEFKTKADHARHLLSHGHSVSDAAKISGAHYSQVHALSKHIKPLAPGEPLPPPPPRASSPLPAPKAVPAASDRVSGVEIGPSQAYQRGYDTSETRQKAIEKLAEANGMSADQYKAALDDHAARILAPGQVFIRASEAGLSKILGDGRFKSVAEVSTSRSGEGGRTKFLNKYRAARKQFEEEHFGEGVPPDKRPIYGYMSGDEHGRPSVQYANELDSYGDIAIRLKGSVAPRTTVTAGDSLSAGYVHAQVPVPLNEPSHRMFTMTESERPIRVKEPTSPYDYASKGWDAYRAEFYEPKERVLDPLHDIKDLSDTKNVVMGYFEAQVHGGLPATEIAHVSFLNGKQPSAGVQTKLKKAGISWSIVE